MTMDRHLCREPGQAVSAEQRRGAKLRYGVRDGWIACRNGDGLNNRPLYGNPDTGAVALAGDRPVIRLLASPHVYGAWTLALTRGNRGRWLHEVSPVECRYQCGRMQWLLRGGFGRGVQVEIEAVPLCDDAGVALRVAVAGAKAGDRLVWAFGGGKADGNVRTAWDPVNWGNPVVRKTGDPRKPQLDLTMDLEACRGNRAAAMGQIFRVWPSLQHGESAVGRWSRDGLVLAADAGQWADPVKLLAAAASERPLIAGSVELRPGDDQLFGVVRAIPDDAIPPLSLEYPQDSFHRAAAYLDSIRRIRTRTPSPHLDAAVTAVNHPIDAGCDRNPNKFRHGCMSFWAHYIGWRVICGATALGWHDRVRGNALHYFAAQIRQDDKPRQPSPDPARRLCHEGPDSPFFGAGRIPLDQHMYNTQSQFFDQTIRDWRWTADPQLESAMRPALDLHLQWCQRCFDPDDDGLYESYINTLPTDTVWYNGGGSVEESAYVYTGHLAARDMARRAGDDAAAAKHQARADKIQNALRRKLWLNHRGHFGLYVEQGGHQRVHEDAWTYSQFLPIDAGMTSDDESLQALYYTEWDLERIAMPYGGQLVQPSNWVPSMWSVRDMFGGDICHLALACFQAGLGDDGWELLNGQTLETAYASVTPGGFSHIGAGADFADNSHMFARTVAEGLFGFDPDYPNGVVRLRPAFPAAWKQAAIDTPDFTLGYRREGSRERYEVTLARPAAMTLRLPVHARDVAGVWDADQPVAWHAEAGPGCTWIVLQRPMASRASISIQLRGRIRPGAAIALHAEAGQALTLQILHGVIETFRDFHDALEQPVTRDNRIEARAAARPGHHMVVAETRVGQLPRRQVFKLHITDTPAQTARLALHPCRATPDADWRCLDLSPHFNGDIRAIFKQQYLTPRPATCSVRLGVDGYAPWTFPYWQIKPPEIDLSNLAAMTDLRGHVLTPPGVPFDITDRRPVNAAITSLWDNWPTSVTVPVNLAGDTAWVLVCGTTFPMQMRIANAVLRFRYADGHEDALELVPPLNFWSLCPLGHVDYSYEIDGFCLPPQPPPQAQLGRNCRAMVLGRRLRPGATLTDLTLETLSQDVVIGLMGLSIMNPA
ncbi:MAG: DUF4450 domain-containing protein [Phycisphaeraceae bacterium]|nr:DUF4450 domain-containing protein [Phycisphaeraceae bacterium]